MTTEEIEETLNGIDFDELNKILDLNSERPQLKYLESIRSLTTVILNNFRRREISGEFTESVHPNETISTVLDFLNSVNPMYAYQFQNIMQEQSDLDLDVKDFSVNFEIKDNKIDESNSYVDCFGHLYAELNGTIRDAFVLMHEMVHKFSKPYFQANSIRLYLAESTPVAMEFALYSYLVGVEKFNSNDLTVYMQNRILNELTKAIKVFLECELYQLKFKYGSISKDVMVEYLSQKAGDNSVLSKLIRKGIVRETTTIIYKGKSYYFILLRYVIGFLVACDFYVRIKDNPDEIEKLFKLDNILGKSEDSLIEDLETIQQMDIPIFGDLVSLSEVPLEQIPQADNFISVTDECLEKYTSSFKSVFEEFFGKSKNNSDMLKKQ